MAEAILPPSAVLLIVDVQKAIDDPRWGRRNNPELEANLARLLAAWRGSGRRVIHVRHLSRERDSTYRPDGPGAPFKPEVLPLPGETVVGKQVCNAFIGTALEAMLRAGGHGVLAIAGVITNNSVEATARMAGDLGFATYVLSDATATVDKRDLTGRLWPAEDVHALSLANLSGEYAGIVDVGWVVRAIAGGA
jgi:nicotinamidase-related amidase